MTVGTGPNGLPGITDEGVLAVPTYPKPIDVGRVVLTEIPDSEVTTGIINADEITD